MSIGNFAAEVFSSLTADLLSMATLKKFMLEVLAKKIGGTLPNPSGDNQTTVTWGGIFNLSDEIAFDTIITRLNHDGHQHVVEDTLSFLSLLRDDQQQRFRVLVGSMGEKSFTRNGQELNVGEEFLRMFTRLSQVDMMNLCQSTGIMTGNLDFMKQQLKAGFAKIDSAITTGATALTAKLQKRTADIKKIPWYKRI